MLADIRTLSSDEFEGRGPGSKGEELTIQYLQDQFRSAGLEPGNPDGSYLQNVRLVGITADPQMKLSVTGHGRSLAPKFQNDFVAWTKRMVDTSAVDADMIFAGYGVQAPEFQWDDFKGVNVRGKIMAEVWVTQVGDEFRLLVAESALGPLVESLEHFIIMEDVTLEPLPELGLHPPFQILVP